MSQENRDENNEQSESKETKIYLTPDSTLQTAEENRHDRSIDPGKNNAISVSNVDLHETNANRFVGSDRAGTAERKDNEIGSE